jgi:hypothetical protein
MSSSVVHLRIGGALLVEIPLRGILKIVTALARATVGLRPCHLYVINSVERLDTTSSTSKKPTERRLIARSLGAAATLGSYHGSEEPLSISLN